MTTLNWRELGPILELAASLEDAELRSWLETVPEDMRSRVMALLSDRTAYGSWASESVARIIESRPRLAAPSDLGPYRILKYVAGGGMGEVYEAEDPRLRRRVAIKVLHADGIRRLDDEAQALASLCHPNICRIYDVGRAGNVEYLVMELLEGTLLADRLRKGPLPLTEAMAAGRALASALAEAHRIGIVHHDVKPGNILLTRNGLSLIDFGIANPATARAGIPAGTPPYMAPEQAGGTSDPRSDVYSAGVVLREMTGGDVPAPVRKVIEACLKENPEDRWQSAADLARALEWLAEPLEARAPVPGWRRWWIGYVIASIVAAAAVLWITRTGDKAENSVLVPLPAPRNHSLRGPGEIAVSPEATRVAFIAPGDAGEPLVWIRKLSEAAAEPLAPTVGASTVFWSPDGQSIGFFRRRKLTIFHPGSGALRELVDAPGPARQAVWAEDDHIIYSVWNIQGDGVIYRIPATGGTPQSLTVMDSSQEELVHSYPVPLAGGEWMLFVAESSPLTYSAAAPGNTYLASVRAVGPRRFLFQGAAPVGTVGDWLYFLQEGNLWSRRLDPAKAQWLTEPKLEAAGVNWAQVTSRGAITYSPAGGKNRAVWVDRQGRKLSDVPVPEGRITGVAVSPGGAALVIRLEDQSSAFGLWVVRGNKAERIGSEFGQYDSPIWSSDGQWIYHGSYAAGLYRRRPFAGAEEELILPKNKEDKALTTTTRDGRLAWIVAHDPSNRRGFDIFRFDLRTRVRQDWSATDVNETQPKLSPDERWIAWLCEYSRDSGRICVSPRDEPRRVTYATSIPSNEVSWSRDGSQLYFTSDDWLYSVRISIGAGKITAGMPDRLFQLTSRSEHGRRYDVDSDNRFLVRDMPRPSPDPILVWNSGSR